MGKFDCPVEKARLTCKFGWRPDPFTNTGRFWHQGIDLASPVAGKKVPVYASADGVIKKAGKLSTYGKRVLIAHTINGKTMETLYAHLDSICVEEKQRVKQGQQIGVMGMTGSSTAVHLHFEIHNGIWVTGQKNAVDPMKWIQLTTCKPIGKTTEKVESKDWTKKVGYDAPKDSKAYRIHTDAFKTKEEAEEAGKSLVDNGYMRYAEVFGNDKDKYRLQSGKYNSQKDAENASKKMIEDNKIGYASIIGRLE